MDFLSFAASKFKITFFKHSVKTENIDPMIHENVVGNVTNKEIHNKQELLSELDKILPLKNPKNDIFQTFTVGPQNNNQTQKIVYMCCAESEKTHLTYILTFVVEKKEEEHKFEIKMCNVLEYKL